MTQGIAAPTLGFLIIIRPASCLWGLRSLIVAFYKRPDSPFWSGEIGKLPIERGSYAVSVGPSGWRVVAIKAREMWKSISRKVKAMCPFSHITGSVDSVSAYRRHIALRIGMRSTAAINTSLLVRSAAA